jgi:hypothetical protein
MKSVAVMARDVPFVELIRDSFCRNNVFPRQVGGGDNFEQAFFDAQLLESDPSPAEMASRLIDRMESLAPAVDRSLIAQLRGRIGSDQISLARCGDRARPLLVRMQALYTDGNAFYFNVLRDCLDVLRVNGNHVPQREALGVIRDTADEVALLPGIPSIEDVLAIQSASLLRAQHAAQRTSEGIFVMTAHQAKGREFDAVILVGADSGSFPDDQDSRRLLYVALTRATKAWVVIHPQLDNSPLLRLCLPAG